jgi:RNA polymerase sigma-70 factor (sigma-E family)
VKPIASLQREDEMTDVPLSAIVSRDVGFDELFAAQRDAMTRLAYLLTGSAGQADEAVQECFARVYERWDALDSPPAFLRVCVVNRCRSWHRHRAVAERHSRLVTADEEYVDQPHEPHDDLAAALAKLPHRRRAAIVLRFYEQLTIAEIASTLGISDGAVKSSLHRGLDQLKGMLA